MFVSRTCNGFILQATVHPLPALALGFMSCQISKFKRAIINNCGGATTDRSITYYCTGSFVGISTNNKAWIVLDAKE